MSLLMFLLIGLLIMVIAALIPQVVIGLCMLLIIWMAWKIWRKSKEVIRQIETMDADHLDDDKGNH